MTNSNTVAELRALLGDKVTADDGIRRERSHDFWLLDFQRRLHGSEAPQPLCVVRPENADDISTLLRFAGQRQIAVVPFGLGSGVCGSARAHNGAVVVDMSAMASVLEINETALTVTVEPGLRGSELEDWLNAAGYTMGHFPQSMRLSSVGGWVATRAAGQYSTKYGSIEDMLVCLEGCLADGSRFSTNNVPRSSTGPSLNELILGSEGTLAVLTRVTFKIHPLAEHSRRGAFEFASFSQGMEAVRLMLRAGWKPALVRLYDGAESKRHFKAHVHRGRCVLLLLSEGPTRLADAEYEECAAIAESAGGRPLGSKPVEHWLEHRFEIADVHDLATRKGVVFDTIEVAANWDRINSVYEAAIAALSAVPGIVAASAHSSHSYMQGTCLYFTFGVKKPRWIRKQVARLLGDRTAFTRSEDLQAVEQSYQRCWQSVMQAVIDNGGTISHHHGIGKVRLPWVEEELAASLYVLRTIKNALDPAGILNPGSWLSPAADNANRRSAGNLPASADNERR
jgi:alkyldihydroxyacetonephosphate synthase